MNLDKTRKLLMEDESFRQFVYDDSTGRPVHSETGKFTVGYGRNLEEKGITNQEARMLLDNDIKYFDDELRKRAPFYVQLDDVRQAVLLSMAFNIGLKGLYGFIDTLKLIKEKKYKLAAFEMLNSKWSDQVKVRASKLASMMDTGKWPGDF